MDFIDLLGSLFSLITDTIGNLVAFIRSIPDFIYFVVSYCPTPVKGVIIAFIPLFVIAITYKFVRGY